MKFALRFVVLFLAMTFVVSAAQSPVAPSTLAIFSPDCCGFPPPCPPLCPGPPPLR